MALFKTNEEFFAQFKRGRSNDPKAREAYADIDFPKQETGPSVLETAGPGYSVEDSIRDFFDPSATFEVEVKKDAEGNWVLRRIPEQQ